MIRAALPLAAFALIACTPAAHPQDQTPVRGAGTCKVEGLDDLIGKKRSPALGREAMRRAGAGVVRWIAPGQMVTMDFRADRLDLSTGPDGRITQVSCG